MPFTFSHPAIILPLKYLPKKWISLTGLIIGSLTPDFEYFLRMKVQSKYSHTFYGIFWFDLPLALLLTFIFHNIIRNELFYQSPNAIRSRIIIFSSFDWNIYFRKNWFVILISLLIGIASHIFWDAFTHEHGYFVKQISILNNSIIVNEKKILFWKILQHLSSLIGAIVIITAFIKLPKTENLKSSFNYKYWIAICIVAFLILSFRFSFSFDFKEIGNIIVSLIDAFLISVILVTLLIKSKVRLEN